MVADQNLETNVSPEGIFLMWCTMENKIPTWDYLQKRTFAGPGWCSLCKDNEENPNHLFLTCSFSKQVWKHSQTLSTTSFSWAGPTLEDSWKS